MDSARDKETRDVIDAETLWDIHLVDKNRYECHGCGIQVWPASYEKGFNKRRPYFSLRHNKHIEPCGVDGIEKVIAIAKDQRVGTDYGFPVPFPNKLVLETERPVVVPDSGNASAGTVTGSGTSSSSKQGQSYHGHTVKTIRPICRIFMEFPNDRESLPLSIPGCPGSTYETVFYRLAFNGIRRLTESTRLFWAPLRWNAPEIDDEYSEWQLGAGTWNKETNKPTNFYRVRIQWADWTERQRETLRHEVEVAREEVKGKKDQGAKAWIFFVGTQDAEDQALIVANHYPLVACRVGELIYPKRPAVANYITKD